MQQHKIHITLHYITQYIPLQVINARHFSQFTTVRSTKKMQRKAEKRCVLRFDLNTCKVLDDVTSDGRLFHIFAAATAKAQLPTVLMVQPVLRSKMNKAVADRGFEQQSVERQPCRPATNPESGC